MDLFKKMLVRLLSVCILVSFNESLASNYKEPIECIPINNRKWQIRPKLSLNFFIHLLLVLTSVAEIVTLLMIRMLEFLFQRCKEYVCKSI